MINISKQPAPDALTQYKKQPDAEYDGPQFTPVKEVIRQQLLDEQGYLCAYCLGRLKNDRLSMKIEHWHGQENYPEEQLDYKNMLAVCGGNEGESPEKQHCDTKKGHLALCYHPANPNHNVAGKITYRGDGTITSNDALLNEQLENVLNLNYIRLKSNRREVLHAVLQILNVQPGTRSTNEIRRILKVWQNRDSEGKYKEYGGIAIYYLNKKLNR
ncbi:MAG: hypothetical protein BWK78_07930 [Thiotrichaceae bacterium IS1]|nr:MAG: hypothetical protein BWK78_07930 [Thiotrichaceae bacterium IS1]